MNTKRCVLSLVVRCVLGITLIGLSACSATAVSNTSATTKATAPDPIALRSGSLTSISSKEDSYVRVYFAVPNPGNDADGEAAKLSHYTVYWKKGENAFDPEKADGKLEVIAETVTTAGEVTIEIDGLKTETIYSLIVEAKNSAGYTSISKQKSIKTKPQSLVPPSPIQELQVSPTTNEVGIQVTWDIPDEGSFGTDENGKTAGFASYIVYWATDSAALDPDAKGSSKRILEITKNTETLTAEDGLQGGTTYTVAIIVENNTGSGKSRSEARTQELTTKDPSFFPGALVLTEDQAVAGSGNTAPTITLTFDPPYAGANINGPYSVDRYTVYWKAGVTADQSFSKEETTENLDVKAAEVTAEGKATIMLEGLVLDTSYGIMVEAHTTGGVSILSNTISKKTHAVLGATPPAVISDFTLHMQNDILSIVASWNPTTDTGTNSDGSPAGFKHYIVYWSASNEELDSTDTNRRIIITDATDGEVVLPDDSGEVARLHGGVLYKVAIVVESDAEGSNSRSVETIATIQTPSYSKPPVQVPFETETNKDPLRLTATWDALEDTKAALGTDEDGNKSEFLHYILYWANLSEGQLLDSTDTSRRILIKDRETNTAVITAEHGIKGFTLYTIALVVENTNRHNDITGQESTKMVLTPDLSTAPGRVTNIVKRNGYTTPNALGVSWKPGAEAKGNSGDLVDTIYEVYVVASGVLPADPAIIISAAGNETQKYSTTHSYYEITDLEPLTLYDIVVVAVNSTDSDLKATSDLQVLRSNGVESILIKDKDDNDISDTQVSKRKGMQIMLRAEITVDSVVDTVIWESSDTSVISIPEEKKNEKVISLTPTNGGQTIITVRAEADPSKSASITLMIPYPARDLNIIVTDYEASNIRHNYILLEIKTADKSVVLDDFRLTLKRADQSPPISSEIIGDGVRERNLSNTAKYIMLFSILGEEPDFNGQTPLIQDPSAELGVLPKLLLPGSEYILYGTEQAPEDSDPAEYHTGKVYNLGKYSTDIFSPETFYSKHKFTSPRGNYTIPISYHDTAIQKTFSHDELENGVSDRKITVRSTEPILIPSSIKTAPNVVKYAYNAQNRIGSRPLVGNYWIVPENQLVSMFWSKGHYDGGFDFGGAGASNMIARAEFTTLRGFNWAPYDGTKNARIVTPVYDNYGKATRSTDKRNTQLYLGLGPKQLKTSAGDITVKRIVSWGHTRNGGKIHKITLDQNYANDYSAITFDFEE